MYQAKHHRSHQKATCSGNQPRVLLELCGVPEVEVTFEIDANDILNVSASRQDNTLTCFHLLFLAEGEAAAAAQRGGRVTTRDASRALASGTVFFIIS